MAEQADLLPGTLDLFLRRASPLGLPYTLSRAPLRRRAPFAWLTRYRSFAKVGFPAIPLATPDGLRRDRAVRNSGVAARAAERTAADVHECVVGRRRAAPRDALGG